MYSVLIVDDEKIIREGLSRHIQWIKHNMKVIGTAANASDAMEFFRREHIDLLITDIRMPIKNGFDLINDVIAEGFNTQVIIISSYDDYAYMRQACILDFVCDYVLKPVDTSSFECILSNVQKRLDEKSENLQSFSPAKYIDLLGRVDETYFDKHKFLQEIINNDSKSVLVSWHRVSDILRDNECSLTISIHFCYNFLLFIENAFFNRRLAVCELLNDNPDIKSKVLEFTQKEELLFYMDDILSRICNSSHDDSFLCKTRLVNVALNRVKQCYMDPDFNLSKLARELNVTPNYLSMKFKEDTGNGFVNYLTGFRICKAKELLANPRHSISEVATQTGFSDVKYFTRVFKSETNMTPKRYQLSWKQHRNDD